MRFGDPISTVERQAHRSPIITPMNVMNPQLLAEIVAERNLTLKERIQAAATRLGKTTSDAIIANKRREFERDLTMKQTVDVLEAAVSAQSKLPVPKLPATSVTLPASPATKPATSGYELVDEYRVLASQEERDVFWKKHRADLDGSAIPEAVLCRIAAGKKIEGWSLTILALSQSRLLKPARLSKSTFISE
jgi:hypothetical protein